MKNMRKFASLLLALVMVFAMATNAFADEPTAYTIVVNDAHDGETYTAYKVFDVTYEGTAYTYTIEESNPFYNAVSTFAGNADNGLTLELVAGSADKYNVKANEKFTDAKAGELAKALAAVENKGTEAGTATATDGTATITVTDSGAGYYFVNTTAGSLCALNTTDPTASITEKNPVPEVDKEVQEDSKKTEDGEGWGEKNDASIGETVYFQTEVKIPVGAKNVKLHDIMSAGLTLNQNVIVTGLDASNYSVGYNVDCDREGKNDNCDFVVTFTQTYLDGLTEETTVTVSYSAVVNENAEIAGNGNPNTTGVTYGNESETTWDSTTTYTWEFSVFKYTGTDTPLAGAGFTLYKGETAIILEPVAGSATYKVTTCAKDDHTNCTHVTEIITGETGKFEIEGLDADTYVLKETTVPAGYNKAADVTVKIDNEGKVYTVSGENEAEETDKEIAIVNNSGSELPSTGGMGTTLFYIVGGILVVAAVVLLVTKKRMTVAE